jgi:hypothetical protein
MKHSSTVYWIESIDKKGKESVVGHSQDDKTKEVYYKFLDRKKALKLIDDERKVSPEYRYRLVKQTTITEIVPFT